MSDSSTFKILKFGGTSMADEHTWHRVLSLIKEAGPCVVVVSATARTTRRLRLAADLASQGEIEEAQKISSEIKQRHTALIDGFIKKGDVTKKELDEFLQSCHSYIDTVIEHLNNQLQMVHESRDLAAQQRDAISSTGERLSSFLLAKCGSLDGLDTAYVDAGEVMITDSLFGKANPELDKVGKRARILSDHIQLGHVPIIGGYYGKTPQGEISTLGLEGSDYTASILGYALHASEIQIWTDVSGVYSCDPRFVDEAMPVPELSYDQAGELAALGAKVLHPKTLEPARIRNIPVLVKNMFKPEDPGTRIHHDVDSSTPVTAIVFKEDNAMLSIRTESRTDRSKVLAVLDRFNVVPDLAIGEHHQVTLSIDLAESSRQEFIEEMESELDTQVRLHIGQIALIGCSPDFDNQLIQDLFKQLDEVPVYLFGRGQQEHTLMITVPGDETLKVVRRLHKQLFGSSKSLSNYHVDDHKN